MEPISSTVTDPRWVSLTARDAAADGTFVYAVKTTGVYCKPSCAARPARPENVVFFASPAEAEAGGFRACLRCRPADAADRHAAAVAAVCAWMDEAEETPQLAEMAARAGLSPYHFHRVFRRLTGLTPRAFAAARKRQRVRESLQRSATVTDAIYDAGYNSNGRFYADAGETLGMTPMAFRAGGAKEKIRFAIGECSLGSILVAASERGVCAIWLGDNPVELARQMQDEFPAAELAGGDAEFDAVVAAAVGMVEQPGSAPGLPLDVRGTAFQQRVWEALRKIPAGAVASYSAVAREIGEPGAVRAVARACAANRLAVAIPCHRVIRQDGAVSGYRWGVERKRELLAREGGK